MNTIPDEYLPSSGQEAAFVRQISNSVVGYGRMKQLISGEWAKVLMDSYPTMTLQSALLGALDINAWNKDSDAKLKLANLIISKLEKAFLEKHTHKSNPCECSDCALLAELKVLKERL